MSLNKIQRYIPATTDKGTQYYCTILRSFVAMSGHKAHKSAAIVPPMAK